MKATIGTVVLTLLPLAAAAQKAPSHHPAAAAESKTPDMAKLEDLMRRMRAQMDTLRSTTDPAERQKLLAGHIQLLQDHMRLLRGPEPAASSGMAGHEDGGMPGTAPRSRARMVEDRIDMLALAMEQMESQIMELARDQAAKK